MANNNTVILTGNLGEDPKQYTKDGKSFVRLSLATTDSYKDKTGNWKQQKPLWHTIFVSVEKAQNAALGFKKGNRIKVTGSLSYRRIRATDKGHSQSFTEATVRGWKIEAVPLPQKADSEASAIGETAA